MIKKPGSNSRNTLECAIYWHNLRYTLDQRNIVKKVVESIPCMPKKLPGKVILQDICGYATPGNILAIIGSSGSGKTTLLNILSKRIQGGIVEGQLEVNGVSLMDRSSLKNYKKFIGYVLQHDAILPFLSVRETLIFNALLTLSVQLTVKEKMERVKEVIDELGLVHCADQYVGNELVRGISGGEKKRLSIGLELLRDPGILFLDEPTSGLDARTALSLFEHLRRIASKYHQTIIASIHQPRAQIFSSFDLLLILAPGGRQIYFGEASKALDYFRTHNLVCPVHENPADFFIDCTTIDFRSNECREESEARISQLADAWKSNTELHPNAPEYSDDVSTIPISKKQLWALEVLWIMISSSVNEVRNKSFLMARGTQSIFLGFILGLLYLRIGNDQSTIADRNGILFFAIVSISFDEILAALTVFGVERAVFFRERDSGTYRISSYWLGKQLSLLPWQLLFPSLFIVVLYFMVGFQYTVEKFFIFYATVILVGLFTGSVGLVLGASLPPTVAAALVPLNNILAVVFSGFLVNLDNIPSFISWIQYISYGKYAFDSVAQNEYTGLKLRCTPGQLVGAEQVCPFTRGEQVINSLNLTELEYWQDCAILFSFILFLRVVLFFTLHYARPTGQ